MRMRFGGRCMHSLLELEGFDRPALNVKLETNRTLLVEQSFCKFVLISNITNEF